MVMPLRVSTGALGVRSVRHFRAYPLSTALVLGPLQADLRLSERWLFSWGGKEPCGAYKVLGVGGMGLCGVPVSLAILPGVESSTSGARLGLDAQAAPLSQAMPS